MAIPRRSPWHNRTDTHCQCPPSRTSTSTTRHRTNPPARGPASARAVSRGTARPPLPTAHSPRPRSPLPFPSPLRPCGATVPREKQRTRTPAKKCVTGARLQQRGRQPISARAAVGDPSSHAACAAGGNAASRPLCCPHESCHPITLPGCARPQCAGRCVMCRRAAAVVRARLRCRGHVAPSSVPPRGITYI